MATSGGTSGTMKTVAVEPIEALQKSDARQNDERRYARKPRHTGCIGRPEIYAVFKW
jgi:hypothetical protein